MPLCMACFGAAASAQQDAKPTGPVDPAVLEDDEQVYLFGMESGGTINGLTVLVNDGGDDIVVANIVGAIDPVVLGRLLAGLDEMPDLEGLLQVGE